MQLLNISAVNKIVEEGGSRGRERGRIEKKKSRIRNRKSVIVQGDLKLTETCHVVKTGSV